MILAVTQALLDEVHRRTPDLGTWAVAASLSEADPAPAANRLAVALLAVSEHDHLRNAPAVPSPEGFRRAPLALRLHYLMTWTGPHDEAQLRLARVLAVFHTTPVLGPAHLAPELAAQVERVTVRLRTTTADERNQVWGALGRPARLALFYDVDVAAVSPLEPLDGWGRIETSRTDLHLARSVGSPS